jgi:hypothetical protein
MGCFDDSLFAKVAKHVLIFEECRKQVWEDAGGGAGGNRTGFERKYLNMNNFLQLLKATVDSNGTTNKQTLLFTSLFCYSQDLTEAESDAMEWMIYENAGRWKAYDKFRGRVFKFENGSTNSLGDEKLLIHSLS